MDVIVIHGYSSSADSIRKSLGRTLETVNKGRNDKLDLNLHYVDYVSLDDQVQLEDVAEALFLELNEQGFLKGTSRNLRFVVHSTGALVFRQLLMQYRWMRLHDRVASIAFVAPANFGSPLAAKGKSQLGRLKTIIVDQLFGSTQYVSELQFGEVGEQILTDLEIASPRQWTLSDFDLYNSTEGCLYHANAIRSAVFVGTKSDSPARLIANLDGTDGVIVTSGAGLNVRRLALNVAQANSARPFIAGWQPEQKAIQLPDVPQLVVEGLDHGSILTDPAVAGYVLDLMAADTDEKFAALTKSISDANNRTSQEKTDRYQQFVFRVCDDRQQPVTDYDLSINVWSLEELSTCEIVPTVGQPLSLDTLTKEQRASIHRADLSARIDSAIRSNAYAHSIAREYRRFLVNVDELFRDLDQDDHVLTFSLIAESGDHRIHYSTTGVNDIVAHIPGSNNPALFFRDTTTQISIEVDRYSDADQIVQINQA